MDMRVDMCTRVCTRMCTDTARRDSRLESGLVLYDGHVCAHVRTHVRTHVYAHAPIRVYTRVHTHVLHTCACAGPRPFRAGRRASHSSPRPIRRLSAPATSSPPSLPPHRNPPYSLSRAHMHGALQGVRVARQSFRVLASAPATTPHALAGRGSGPDGC